MDQQAVFSIKMVAGGVELVLKALNELPHGAVRGLYDEIAGQYAYQVQQLQQAAQKAAEPAVEASVTQPEESQS